jgi:hypothetical protein
MVPMKCGHSFLNPGFWPVFNMGEGDYIWVYHHFNANISLNTINIPLLTLLFSFKPNEI